MRHVAAIRNLFAVEAVRIRAVVYYGVLDAVGPPLLSVYVLHALY